MLILNATTDKLQLITSAAVALDVHASYMDMSNADPPVVKGSTSGRQNTAISTATTTDVVASPAASTVRNVKTLHARNKSGSTSVDVTVQYNQNATLFELHKATVPAGASLEYVEGIGFFVLQNTAVSLVNQSTSAQGPTFSADVYVIGSSVTIPSTIKVGSLYRCVFDVTKTAAGTAAPTISIRIGTAGSTADTARNTFTLSAGTAAVDTGVFTVQTMFRSVGAGTAAVTQGTLNLDSNPTSGISSLAHAAVSTSAGFDSTVANSIIGISVLGGTSAAWTVQNVRAEIVV